MSWTDERIETLRKMWEEGHPASRIAEQLGGVSRNAVIGKAHRLGLEKRPSPVKGDKAAAGKTGADKPGAEKAAVKKPKKAKPAEMVPAGANTAETTESAAASAEVSAPKPAAETAAAKAPEQNAPAAAAAPASTPAAPESESEANYEIEEETASLEPRVPLSSRSDVDQSSTPAPRIQIHDPRPAPRPAPKKPMRPAPRSEKIKDKTSLLDLNERICKWPIGHPGEPEFHFCGQASEPGFPYCNAHCAEAYQAQQPRKDRPGRTPMPNLPRPR